MEVKARMRKGGVMAERTVSSTVEIDAPVETVFDYCDNPQRAEEAMQASAGGRFSHIRDVRRGPDGLVTTYKIVTPRIVVCSDGC